MKVIDLAIKKTNNEEMPKKFKFDGSTFIYYKGDYRYEHGNISFFNDYCSPIYHFEDFIETVNKEIEIIDDEAEDEEIMKWGEGALEEIKTKKDYKIEDLQFYIELLMKTQNQIIDKIRSSNE